MVGGGGRLGEAQAIGELDDSAMGSTEITAATTVPAVADARAQTSPLQEGGMRSKAIPMFVSLLSS